MNYPFKRHLINKQRPDVQTVTFDLLAHGESSLSLSQRPDEESLDNVWLRPEERLLVSVLLNAAVIINVQTHTPEHTVAHLVRLRDAG